MSPVKDATYTARLSPPTADNDGSPKNAGQSTKDGRPMVFESNAAASDTQQVPYRAIARAIRQLGTTVRHVEAKQELELLALRYQRLAEFREELSLLRSLRQPRAPVAHIQFAMSRHR